MIHEHASAAVYSALDAFRQRCLDERRSLCLDDDDALSTSVWTAASAQELVHQFIDQPDMGKRSYVEKLRDQLSDASAEALQLLVDLTWLHVVVSRFYKPDTKRRIIGEVAELGAQAIPSGIFDDALEKGLALTGTSFVTRRPNQLWLLIRFAQAWLGLSEEENQRLLDDPWAFRVFVFGLDGVADQTQRHALIHLIHPGCFEDILSQYHKRDIVEAVLPGIDLENIDRGLEAARNKLTPTYGDGFSFYQPDVLSLWRAEEEPDPPPVVEPTEERRAWLVRGSGGERVPEWLNRGLCAVYFEDSFPFAIEPGTSRDELRSLADEAGVDTTAGGFNNELGQVWRFVNSVAVGDYVVTVNGQEIYLGVVESAPKSSGDRARRETFRRVEWLNADRPVLRGMVAPAVYSKLKTLLTLSNISSIVDNLEAWANGNFPTPDDDDTVDVAKVELDLPDRKFADRLLMPKNWLQKSVELLNAKKQIVLYGPPGTGKTFLAQELAEFVTADGGSTELVQFHPSYAYEDFFEGFRPTQGVGGAVSFELKPGPLRRIAELAVLEPTKPHVLIIDEINRANVAKVFGELYFLLEYRGRTITLQYSDDEFTLPENLFVIGTMNTADRSIALVDAAMRRRFYFIAMTPDKPPIDGLLRKWLESNELPNDVADVLDELNRQIGDPDASIGPSFLMNRSAADESGLERIWEHSILPLLQERFYGTADSGLERFELRRIRRLVNAAAQQNSQDAPSENAE